MKNGVENRRIRQVPYTNTHYELVTKQIGERQMKLMTKEIEKKIPKGYGDGRIYAKYFHPLTFWKWYAMSYDPDSEIFYGFVHGDFPELGSFSLDDLKSIEKLMGLPVERDLYWDDTTTIDMVSRASNKGFPL